MSNLTEEEVLNDPRVDEIMKELKCDRQQAAEILWIELGGNGDVVDDE